jgi:hypothetical protein
MFSFLKALAPKTSARPAKSRSSVKPMLETLESRLTPSSTQHALLSEAPTLDTASALIATTANDAHTSHSGAAVSPDAETEVTGSATVDFSPCPKTDQKTYTITITVQGKGDIRPAVFSETITNVSPTLIRNQFFNDMSMAGWQVTKSGDTALEITASRGSPLILFKISSTNLEDKEKPGVTATSGIQRGQITTGGDWQITFNPGSGTPVVQENGQVQATIDGVLVSANITAGMTPTDVASALFGAMQAAGMNDAVLSGNTITFLNDTAGEETLNVSVNFTAVNSTDSLNWLEVGITLPDRYVIT